MDWNGFLRSRLAVGFNDFSVWVESAKKASDVPSRVLSLKPQFRPCPDPEGMATPVPARDGDAQKAFLPPPSLGSAADAAPFPVAGAGPPPGLEFPDEPHVAPVVTFAPPHVDLVRPSRRGRPWQSGYAPH